MINADNLYVPRFQLSVDILSTIKNSVEAIMEVRLYSFLLRVLLDSLVAASGYKNSYNWYCFLYIVPDLAIWSSLYVWSEIDAAVCHFSSSTRHFNTIVFHVREQMQAR